MMKKEVILVILISFLIVNVSAFNFEDRSYGLEKRPPTLDVLDLDLNDLGDVNAPAPNDNDALTWDDATSKWIAEAISAVSRWLIDPNQNYITNTSTTLSFNETKLNATIDSKLAITYYNATSIDIIAGTDNTNDLTALQQYDGITYNISEAVGAPAMDVRINFTGVADFNQLTIRMRTTSGGKHRYKIQIWDYAETIWEDYTNFVEVDIFKVMDMGVYDASDHISGGLVQVRIYLEDAGVPAHEVFIDWISLSDGISTYSTSEVDPLSWHRDANIDAENYNATFDVINSSIICIGSCYNSSDLSNLYNHTSTVYDLWNAIWLLTYNVTYHAHILSTGTSHTYIDQPVTRASTPEFAGLQFGDEPKALMYFSGLTNLVIEVLGSGNKLFLWAQGGIWTGGGSFYLQTGDIIGVGDLDADLLNTTSLITDSNENIAFDVVKHTITSDEADDYYFYEEWTKATPEEIVSLDAIIWLNGTNEVYDVSRYYNAYPTVPSFEVKITTDESEELYVSDEGGFWLEGNVVKIFITYEV